MFKKFSINTWDHNTYPIILSINMKLKFFPEMLLKKKIEEIDKFLLNFARVTTWGPRTVDCDLKQLF